MSRSAKVYIGDGRPETGIDAGSFVLAGVNQPDQTLVLGDLASVSRETKGAVIFFRVKSRHRLTKYDDARGVVSAIAELTDALSAVRAYPIIGRLVRDSDSTLPTADEVDIIVTDAAGAPIDTAGLKVNVFGIIAV